MNRVDDVGMWARQFGLATAPLFEHDESDAQGSHSVLLDGASGTFALSVSEEELWRRPDPANWVWSSDIPHHVTVTPEKVAVLRWDRPSDPRIFGRQSIERNLDRFYGFLTEDRLRSNQTVVDHLLSLFRRLRSLGHAAHISDGRATDLFTASLARMMVPADMPLSPTALGVSDDADELLARLDQRGYRAAVQEVEQGSGTLSWLKLHTSLAIRHAGGQLFQEAHFELLRGATDFDLFGLVGNSEVSTTSRGGTHFTPPTLARSLVEQAIAALAEPLDRRSVLTLCDPACGSGAFLHEALRVLRRSGFEGRLRLIGYDISPAAIAMARFVLAASLRDWAPAAGVEVDLRIGDSLGELGIPAADVIVMNPPFIGFAAQTARQRDQLTAALGSSAGRGDYSMAFVQRALEALNAGGVLGTLFPASLLSLMAASGWRDRLLAEADICFLASIGDFGLFSHAMVQVAAAVFSKGQKPGRELIALITENDPQATSVALRHVRRGSLAPSFVPVVEQAWSAFPVPASALRDRPTWRLPTPGAERVLRVLSQSGLSTVGDLFTISQGIQTGLNSALLLSAEDFQALPAKERHFFRQATMTDAIQNGRIVKAYWLFFPHDAEGPIFSDEATLRKAVPQYFARFLEPNRTRLESRATIVQSRRTDWWGLMRPREWSVLARPRIISKFFGAEGGFFGDYEAKLFAVMGHVWTLKARSTESLSEHDDSRDEQFSEQDVLAAFVALCNSEVFIKLLALYAPHVAGGQFDLSARHVTPVPVPDLHVLAQDPDTGRAVRKLSALGREVDVGNAQWRQATNGLVGLLYGGIDFDAI